MRLIFMGEWEEGDPRASEPTPVSAIQVVGFTDVGRVRQNNEDNFLIADLSTKVIGEPSKLTKISLGERGTLLLVTDGMGGRNAGEIASQIVVDVFRNELLGRDVKNIGCEVLAEITKKANWAIWSRAQRNTEEQGMGATLTALVIESSKAHIVQVGDSRAYVVRSNAIFQLTKDQSMVQTLIDSGIIKPEEADTHPYRHVILQSLGAEPTVYPVTSTIDLYNGDYLLLCTDGLSNMVKDAILQELILSAPDLEMGCQILVETANVNGGKDNITIILAALEYSSTPEMAEADFGTRTQSYFTMTGGLMPPIGFQPEDETKLVLPEDVPRLDHVDTPFPALLTPEPEPLPTPVPAPAKDRVLIIDSEPERLLSFEFILKPYYSVISATDGEEGLAKAITELPRLIVASVELNKIGGISLCQALKGNERFRNIPIILISAKYTDKNHVIEALSTGADEYLLFPIDERELLLRVKPYAERAKLLEQLRYESALNEATNIQLHIEMETVAKARQDIFQNVLDATSDGILILDPAGWVTAVNQTFEDFHRVQKDHIIGFGYRALLKKIQHLYESPERQLQRFTELINNPEMIADDEVKTRSEKRGVAKMKRYSAPVRDESGRIYGRFFVFRNLIQ
ncbi:MAG: response regulator [Acidobacteriota bacterium]